MEPQAVGRVDLVQTLMQHKVVGVVKKGNEELHAKDGQIERPRWYGKTVTLHYKDQAGNDAECELWSKSVRKFFQHHNSAVPGQDRYNLKSNSDLQSVLNIYSDEVDRRGLGITKGLAGLKFEVNEASRDKKDGDIKLTKNGDIVLDGDTLEIDMIKDPDWPTFCNLMDEVVPSLIKEERTPKNVIIRNGTDDHFKFWQNQKRY